MIIEQEVADHIHAGRVEAFRNKNRRYTEDEFSKLLDVVRVKLLGVVNQIELTQLENLKYADRADLQKSLSIASAALFCLNQSEPFCSQQHNTVIREIGIIERHYL